MHDRSLELRPVTCCPSKIAEVFMRLADHSRGKRLELIEVLTVVEPRPVAPLAPTVDKRLVRAVGTGAIAQGHPDIVRDAEAIGSPDSRGMSPTAGLLTFTAERRAGRNF
jgi:hypothetical protein